MLHGHVWAGLSKELEIVAVDRGVSALRHAQRPLGSLRGGLARPHPSRLRQQEGETNHVERWFGTLRARVSRLVRKAYSFSKCPENHLDAIHLFITTYNLAIQPQATTR